MSDPESLPKISIVIPSYNQGQYIEQTITSVLGQNYPNLELIVMDGGSTDATVTILKKYNSALAYWVSEPDKGQAHAINQGFRRATGEILAWLNSDDMYLPGTLTKVVHALGSIQAPRLVYGGCIHFKEGAELCYAKLPEAFDPERLTYHDYIIQPSCFWTRPLWKLTGELNETYHYALDWDWFIRASRLGTFIPLPDYLSLYRIHSSHKTGTGGMARSLEVMRVVETHASEDWIITYREVLEEMVKADFSPIGEKLKSLGRCRIELGKFYAEFYFYTLRYLLYPWLYFKRKRRRFKESDPIGIAFNMLI
ncbi:hypothetical protein BST81_08620 [Leptolyngbya sp. 'hensonii']|uniref:glycosyltransferase family 2 protein n=1 Tax=Leptolyngbya sp. 'hensonii' TaxID=1922337 RepID=UPI0009500F68|nr:glycosyltransferase family 2 protein [Leptolyngbya sp. 'hensonii']OLP18793.1 hypothetical protein BST81_08620 [Leptolyngbya sp. 'hensonii']